MKTLSNIAMSMLLLVLIGAGSPANAANASVKMVQEGLVKLGYDPGVPDGAWGGNSRKALNAFQADNGFQKTRSLSKGLISLFDILSKGAVRDHAIPLAERIGNTLVLSAGAKVHYTEDGRKLIILPNGKRVNLKWRKRDDGVYCEGSFNLKRETCEPEEDKTYNVYKIEDEYHYFQKNGKLRWRIKVAAGDQIGQ